MSQTTHTNGSAIAHAAGKPITMEIEVSADMKAFLDRADKKPETGRDLRALLAGEVLLTKLTPEVMATKGLIEQGILMAQGLAYLRSVLTQAIVEQYFLPLQNNPRGFLTDRKPDKNDPGGYVWWIVRDCLIDAFSRGLPVIGNHFNIISERMYITRNGMTFLLQHLPGLTDLRISPGVPEITDLGGLVEVSAKWMLNGRPDKMSQTIAVRVNKGQGADAILGKADRKFKAALYSRLTGTVFTEEGELEEPLTITAHRSASTTSNPNEVANQALDKLKQQTALQADPPTPTGAQPVNAPASAPATTTNTTEQHSESDQGDAPSEAAAGTGRSQQTKEPEGRPLDKPVDADEQAFLESLRR